MQKGYIEYLTEWRAMQKEQLQPSCDCSTLSIGLIADFTITTLTPCLGVLLAEKKILASSIEEAPFNQIFQTCFNHKQIFSKQEPECLLIAWRLQNLCSEELLETVCHKPAAFQVALEKVAELARAIQFLRKNYSGTLIVTLPEWPVVFYCNPDNLGLQQSVNAFHQNLVQTFMATIGTGVDFIDLDMTLRTVGINNAYDTRSALLYRNPYTHAFMESFAKTVIQTLSLKKIPAKKCLVLDCDNTLWGGVIGEDGLAGIELSNDFPGLAYREFQKQIVALKKQGILITLCSKNNEPDVMNVFEHHDSMVLKKEHLVAWRINWKTKAENIASLAQGLNIGLDSFVFVDDNPMEIESVKQALPMVTCLLVDEDIADFIPNFSNYRGFDKINVTQEDLVRSAMIQSESERQKLQQNLSQEDFFKNLNMTIKVHEAESVDLARVAQLINKTNQFTLTTKRRTDEEIQALFENTNWLIYTMRLKDRFGEYGLVGTATIEINQQNATAHMDSYQISCRALGREAETAFFCEICKNLQEKEIKTLSAAFIPSPKNTPAADFLQKMNCTQVDDILWSLPLKDSLNTPTYISLV